MDLKTLLNWGSEIVFCLCGLVSFNAAWRGLQNEKCRIGTFVFWTILGLIFILGPYIPYALTGALLLVLGCLTATKQVQMGKFVPSEASFRKAQADKLGNKIFLPAITIGVVALALSMLKFSDKTPVISFPMLWGMIPAAVCDLGGCERNPGEKAAVGGKETRSAASGTMGHRGWNLSGDHGDFSAAEIQSCGGRRDLPIGAGDRSGFDPGVLDRCGDHPAEVRGNA